MPDKDTPTSVILTPEQKERIKKEAEQNERSVSWVIRKAVDEHIARERYKLEQ